VLDYPYSKDEIFKSYTSGKDIRKMISKTKRTGVKLQNSKITLDSHLNG